MLSPPCWSVPSARGVELYRGRSWLPGSQPTTGLDAWCAASVSRPGGPCILPANRRFAPQQGLPPALQSPLTSRPSQPYRRAKQELFDIFLPLPGHSGHGPFPGLWPPQRAPTAPAAGRSFSCSRRLSWTRRVGRATNMPKPQRPTRSIAPAAGSRRANDLVGHGGHRTAAERRDFALGLAREGFDGKACAALLAEGLCPATPETVAELRALHPAQPTPTPCPMEAFPLGPDLTPAAVSRALRSFPASTAPGPSGLRVQHLRDACLPGSTDAFIDHLLAIVALLSNGQACVAAAPFLAGASLVAVPKPRGGVRPIAIGEVLRRLTGKCLMESVRGRAREHLFPAQVGVTVPAGAEAAVHAVRAWATRHRDAANKVLLKLDFTNAFNTVSRQQVLHHVRSQFPELARWVTWCYGAPSHLQFGDSSRRCPTRRPAWALALCDSSATFGHRASEQPIGPRLG